MLSDDTVLLLRIVNPTWVQDDKVTHLVFTKSKGRPISMFDGGMISPEDAMRRFMDEGHDAYGVIGVSVREAKALGMVVIEDRTPCPEHISLDFPKDLGNSQCKAVSKALRDKAMERGFLCRAKD